MVKRSNLIQSLLGRFSSEKKIIFPLDLNPEDLMKFVDKFSNQEKIELFCLVEYLVYSRITNDEKSQDFPSLLRLEDLLNQKIQAPQMVTLREKMGLRTSIDRLNLGRSLAL